MHSLELARRTPHAGRIVRLAYAFVLLVCLSSVHAIADPVAASIGTTVAGLEWNLERAERCQMRADSLQRRLDRLRSDPAANASAITEAETRLLTSQRCVQSSTERASSLELSLASLREQLLSDTGADALALATRIDALRTDERERATLDLDIRYIQLQIDQLRRAVPLNQVALNQRVAVQDGLRSTLAAVVVRIASANQVLAEFEASALAVIASRSATLNWTTPLTREDGAPLAVGELGGFEIYMLAESTGQTSIFTVDDPMMTMYTVDGLAPDTYHFSMSAFDIQGVFSPLSEIVAKVVR
jgi:hypothetical protein